MIVTQEYDLNLVPGGVPVRIPVSQYDSNASRWIQFNLYSGEYGNGVPYIIPDGATILIEGFKPDGTVFSRAYSFYSENHVTVPVSAQMTSVPGDVICQLSITKVNEYSPETTQTLGTANYILAVEESVMRNRAVVSQNDLASFSELVELAADSATQATTAAATVTSLANRLRDLDAIDLNSIKESGLYYVRNTCTNTPYDGKGWVWTLEVVASANKSVVKQVVKRAAQPEYEFERVFNSSVWSDWAPANITHDDVIIVTASFGDNYNPYAETDAERVYSFNHRCKDRIEASGSRKCYLATQTGGGFVNDGFLTALRNIESTVTRPDKVSVIMICGGGNDVRSENYQGRDYSYNGVNNGIARFMEYATAHYPNAIYRFAWLSWRKTYSASLPQRDFNKVIIWMQDLLPRNGIAYCANSEWIYHQYYDDWYIPDNYHPSNLASVYIADRIMECINNGSTSVTRLEDIPENTFLHRTSAYEESNPIREQCGFTIRVMNGTTTITPTNMPNEPSFKINFAAGFLPTTIYEIPAYFTFNSGLFKAFIPSEKSVVFPITMVAVGTNRQDVFQGYGRLYAGIGYFGGVRPTNFDSSLYTELWFYLPTITLSTSYA